MNVEELLKASELTSKSRITDDSRYLYGSKMKYIIEFIQNKFPDEIIPATEDEGVKLKLPLTFNAVKVYLYY